MRLRTYRKVLQKDPENERGLELLTQIAGLLRANAEKVMATGDLAGASEIANQALLVAPEDAQVQDLLKRITETQQREANAARIAELLQKAIEAEKRNQITGAEGAYALLRSALALDASNADVIARLKALTDAEFARVRNLLADADLDTAERALADLREQFGGDPAFVALNAEIEQAKTVQAGKLRIEGLLAKARGALDADRISEPAGDNAFEWFEQARQIDFGNPAVVAFKQILAERILGDARTAQARKDIARALDRAELALRVDPDLAAAVRIRDDARQSLGAQQAQIATQLNLARAAIASGRLLPPATDNARDVLDALLREDPTNADALKLRDALPRVVADALRGAVERNEMAVAVPLADAAAIAYPDDSRIAAQISAVREKIAASQAQQALAEQEQRLARLLQRRPLNAESAAAAATGIVELRAVDDEAASRFEQQLAQVLSGDLNNASDLDAGQASAAAIRAANGPLAGSQLLAALTPVTDKRIAELQAKRDAELAAQNGELVINATPWGTVDRVLDASRKPVELPAERTTPLRLTLPAGSYYVTLTHPDSRKSVSAFARVKAGQRSQANAAFPSLSSEEYLKNAGL
jgi:serine/threonine-protein kinase PpkA